MTTVNSFTLKNNQVVTFFQKPAHIHIHVYHFGLLLPVIITRCQVSVICISVIVTVVIQDIIVIDLF
jgi:hypothetical protein